MNRATHDEIQEMLPDLLHGSLDAETRQQLEVHVASCDSCTEDLAALRTVKGAAVFAPSINVDQIVRQIPPYKLIVPRVERPVRTRVVAWAVAAALIVTMIGGGSLLFPRQASRSRIASNDRDSMTTTAQASPEVVSPPVTVTTPAAPGPYALASATDLGDLTDGNLVQLMNDMDDFDALPAAEPEPVISVDNGDSL